VKEWFKKLIDHVNKVKLRPGVVALVFIITSAAGAFSLVNGVIPWLRRIEDRQPRIGVLALAPREGDNPKFIIEPFLLSQTKLTVLHIGVPRTALATVSGKLAACIKLPIVVGARTNEVLQNERVIFRFFEAKASPLFADGVEQNFIRNTPELCDFEKMFIDKTLAGETAQRSIQNMGINLQIAYRLSDVYPDKMDYLHFYIGAVPNVEVVDDDNKVLVRDKNGEIATSSQYARILMRPTLMTVSTLDTKSETKAGYVLLMLQSDNLDADIITTGVLSSDQYREIVGRLYGVKGIRDVEEIFWMPEAKIIPNDLMQEIFGGKEASQPLKSVIDATAQGATKFLILSEGRFSSGCFRSRVLFDGPTIDGEPHGNDDWEVEAPMRDYISFRNDVRAALVFQRQMPENFERLADSHISAVRPLADPEAGPVLTGLPASYSPVLAVWNGCLHNTPSPEWYWLK
jgi:hypothetical protein